jgi:hypothetical protein
VSAATLPADFDPNLVTTERYNGVVIVRYGGQNVGFWRPNWRGALVPDADPQWAPAWTKPYAEARWRQ